MSDVVLMWLGYQIVSYGPARTSEVTTLWRCTNMFIVIIIIIIIRPIIFIAQVV